MARPDIVLLPLLWVFVAINLSGAVLLHLETLGEQTHESNLPAADNFVAFIEKHSRTYREGSQEYVMRHALFRKREAAVHAQNSRQNRRWMAGLNSLADWTLEELETLRGYRHGARPSASIVPGTVGLVSAVVQHVNASKLPQDFSWKQQQLKAMQEITDQGGCGSCWAISSATVLRAHAELFQTERTFSTQQIVACTPNPRQCGGSGGCGGATAELAMDYAVRSGLVTEDSLQYTAKDSKCPQQMKPATPSLRTALWQTVSFPEVTVTQGGGAGFGLIGWRKLPENKAEPLMHALYTQGPVTVSVAANDAWTMYSSGVMDACPKEAVINHAVVLVGFGEDADTGAKYWQIQNSWGPDWGEDGFGRLLRRDTHEEEQYCGWDRSPEDGTACKGGPSKVWVCGSCGILYDSVVPKFTLSKDGWWHRVSGRNLETSV